MHYPLFYILLMLLCGVGMGVVFDIYNTLIYTTRWLRKVLSVLDITFFILAAIVVYQLSLVTDNGKLRLYTFAFLVIGYVIYRATFHHTVIASAQVFFRLVHLIVQTFYKVIRTLIFTPSLWVLRLVSVLLQLLYHVGRQVEDVLCWCLALLFCILRIPFHGYLKIFSRIVNKLHPYQEGIWSRVSNWLKKNPRRV